MWSSQKIIFFKTGGLETWLDLAQCFIDEHLGKKELLSEYRKQNQFLFGFSCYAMSNKWNTGQEGATRASHKVMSSIAHIKSFVYQRVPTNGLQSTFHQFMLTATKPRLIKL